VLHDPGQLLGRKGGQVLRQARDQIESLFVAQFRAAQSVHEAADAFESLG